MRQLFSGRSLARKKVQSLYSVVKGFAPFLKCFYKRLIIVSDTIIIEISNEKAVSLYESNYF